MILNSIIAYAKIECISDFLKQFERMHPKQPQTALIQVDWLSGAFDIYKILQNTK